jgi:hypothetical protein
VVVRTPPGVPNLVGGQVSEDRMLEMMAQLSAREPGAGAIAWIRHGGRGSSMASRILLALGGIGAVLAVLLLLMWLTGLLL